MNIRTILQNRMKNLRSGSAVWSSSVLQKRIKDLQWLCSLDFFSPLRFGPSSYSPMSRVKSLKSGSAERTKGLQTYGSAVLDTGNRRPIWILMNKPYEAVHLAMFSGVCFKRWMEREWMKNASPSTLRRWMGRYG